VYGIFNNDFVKQSLLSPMIKECWKSVNICRSYGQKSSVLFFDWQCGSVMTACVCDSYCVYIPRLRGRRQQSIPRSECCRVCVQINGNWFLLPVRQRQQRRRTTGKLL